MWERCCWACMCSCLHACKWGLQARINKEMALVAYSQAWSTAREIILCSGISARELTVHHLDLGGSTKKAALPGAEGAALSFSVFYGREFSSQLQRQNPLIALLVCKDSAMRQSGLWHQHKPVLDIQIFQNTSCWGLIKLTPISQAARTCTTPECCLCASILSWCCHLGCRVQRNQVWAKQHLVTEAGQRGCWDTQRLNRQPACHPLFFSSP